MSPQYETTQQDQTVVAKYLLEAHGKECQLETALQGQLALAQGPLVQHALRDHLDVTRRQIGSLERRIDELGGAPSHGFGVVDSVVESVVELTGSVVNRSIALAKFPLQALRGTSPADNELRMLRDCYWNEAEEIAHYRVIETLANELGDTETAELAARHRAEEEAMQHTLEELIPGAVQGVVASEASPDAAQAPTAQATEATPPAASASVAEPKGKAAKPAARVKKATPKAAAASGSELHVKPIADSPDRAEPQVSTDELLERALAPKPIPGQPADTPAAPTAAELATAAIADADPAPDSAPAAKPKAKAKAAKSAARTKKATPKPAARAKKAAPKPAAASGSELHVKPIADSPDRAEPQVSTDELLERALAPKPIPGQPAEAPAAPTAAELATAALADADPAPEA